MESSSSWLDAFTQNEQCLPSWKLQKSIDFLRSARVPSSGWGEYPRLSSTLHCTSLAILALAESAVAETKGVVGGAAAFARDTYGTEVQHLSLEELCDFLNICSTERRPDDGLADSIFAEISTRLLAASDGLELSVRVLAAAIVALDMFQSPSGADLLRGVISRLRRLQNADGGFSPVAATQSVLVTTAIAARALSRADGVPESYARCMGFLGRELAATRWSSMTDVLSHATVLWAVAQDKSFDYMNLKEGVDLLIERRNPDGSWGATQGSVGDIEHTSLSLRALVASGEQRFLPLRLAVSTISAVQHQLNQITGERDNLKQSIEQRVQEDCGQVVRERNDLLSRNKQLARDRDDERAEARAARDHIEGLELRLKLAERERELLRRSYIAVYSRSSLRAFRVFTEAFVYMLPVLGVTAIGAAAWDFAQTRWQVPTLWLIGATIPFGALAIGGLLTQRERLRLFARLAASLLSPREVPKEFEVLPEFQMEPEMLRGEKLGNLRRMYIDMTEDWPRDTKDELGYRLARELVNMPPELGIRYVDDLMLRLSLPQEAGSQLSMWLRYFLRLSPAARRVLVEQVTRGTLR